MSRDLYEIVGGRVTPSQKNKSGSLNKDVQQEIDTIADRLLQIRLKAEEIPSDRKWAPGTSNPSNDSTSTAIYDANAALRLEIRELKERRKDAERDRDVWMNRLTEQQNDSGAWTRRLQEDEYEKEREGWKIGYTQLQEAKAEIKRLQQLQTSSLTTQPSPGEKTTDLHILFAFRDLRQRIQVLVDSPHVTPVWRHFLSHAGQGLLDVQASRVLKSIKSNDLRSNLARWEVLYGSFRTSLSTEDQRKLRLRGFIFKELYHGILDVDPWLGKLKLPGPLVPDTNARAALDRVAGRIVDILRPLTDGTSDEVGAQATLQKMALELVNAAYAFRNRTGNTTPRYVVCDPFPEEGTERLVDCEDFVEAVGWDGPKSGNEDARVQYTVFGGLVKLPEVSSVSKECKTLQKVQVVLVQDDVVTHNNSNDGSTAEDEEEL